MDKEEEIIEEVPEETSSIPKADTSDSIPQEYGEFSDQGIVVDEPVSYTQGRSNNSQRGVMDNFRAGQKAGKDGMPVGKNPARGVRPGAKPAKAGEQDKNLVAPKSKDTPTDSRNVALGKKMPKADSKGNQMPGARPQDQKKPENNSAAKKGANSSKSNTKKSEGINKSKNNTPFGRASKVASGARKLAAGSGGNKGDGIGGKLRSAWAALPISTKILILKAAIIVTTVLLAIVVISMLITALIGGTTAAIAGAMCSNDGQSSNGIFSEYEGGGNITEFLCKMQSPLGGTSYVITAKAGEKRSYEMHPGIDLAKHQGTPVYAAQSGTVTRAGLYGGYGYCVDIDHGSGFMTRYGHMPSGAIKVKKGDRVGKGQRIGSVGSTGRSTGPHLHFEIRINGQVTYAQNAYFGYKGTGGYEQRTVSEEFKQQCGSSWDGEPAGDSANTVNDDTDVSSSYSGSSENGECCTTAYTSSSSSSSGYCPNGITVTGNNAGTYDLDEYIEKVVTCENGGAHPEALKALAIAARTYAINRTDNCTKSIVNSTAAQVMCSKASDKVKNALQDVKGSILLYNGKYFSAEYSSFWGTCSGSTCSGSAKKVPSNETVTYSMPSQYYTLKGHERGLSQNGSNYMAHSGKKFDEILKFFYADGIEITGVTGSSTCSLGANGSFSGKIWDYAQSDYSNAYCGGTIANSGCGPTSMAMIVSTFLNEKHDPPELAKIAKETGHCSTNTHEYFVDAAKKYGLKLKQTTTPEEVLTALNRGDSLVIVNVKASSSDTSKLPNNFWTSGGHYIVLAGHNGNDVWVQDPNKGSSNRTNNKGDGVYNFNKHIVPAASWYGIFTKA